MCKYVPFYCGSCGGISTVLLYVICVTNVRRGIIIHVHADLLVGFFKICSVQATIFMLLEFLS